MTLLYALVLLPALGALGAAAYRGQSQHLGWLGGIAALHLALTGVAWNSTPPAALGGWLALDGSGLIVLTVVSVLFAVAALYRVGYLRRESPAGARLFASCLLAFLASASLVTMSHHFALLWVGLEATTLSVAPLIYHRHDRASLEAVWKYLMLSSVGIAMALLGTFLLAASQSAGADTGRPLVLEDLVAAGHALHPSLLRAACVFLLVGFGTKMGLVPLHAWKADVYREAPSLVAALMAGGLTSCAFLGLVRTTQVATAAGLSDFFTPLLVTFGLASLGVAAVLLLGQSDLKRLLAYSSIEHMGLLTLGLGLGGVSVAGSLLHVINNGLAKGLLFLTAGNVLRGHAGGPGEHRGLLRVAPVSGVLLVVGLFAVTGSPPFGTFLSEFTILRGAFGGGHPWIGGIALTFLVVAFAGLARPVIGIVFGPAAESGAQRSRRESAWLVAGPILLAAGLLALGIFVPPALRQRIAEAAAGLGGRAP
jgi:hydrogenase-4 component F